MKKMRLESIRKVLNRYKYRYLWLNVFASEVDLSERAAEWAFYTTDQPDVYEAKHANEGLRIVLDRRNNVARFCLLDDASEVSGIATDIDFALDTSRKSPASVGYLLGLLVGGFLKERQQVDANRIFPLCYDPSGRTWAAYHGDYLGYAKCALHPLLANAS